MEFKELVSVSGIAGLKRICAQRADGLILSELNGEGKKFYANRVHLFSPLENISIYTEDDSTPLLDVFIEMKNQQKTNPPIAANADGEALRGYLAKILPDFDREKVQMSDIKKLIKWYEVLEPMDILKKEEAAVKPEEKPAPKKEPKVKKSLENKKES